MKNLIIRHDDMETLERYLHNLEKATRYYYNVYGLRRIDSHKNEIKLEVSEYMLAAVLNLCDLVADKMNICPEWEAVD